MSSPCPTHIPLFPVGFAVALRDLCGIRIFVETGTYRGDTVVAVAPHFERVLSVEGCRERYEAVLRRDDLPSNVELWPGDSAIWLDYALQYVKEPAIIFLDAHWIAAGSTPEEDVYQGDLAYCPLRGELSAIREGDVVLIDDAHFFTHPPHNRGDDEQWLSLDQIVALLPSRYVFIHEGILCAVPEWYRAPMQGWLQKHWRGLQRYIDNRQQYGGDAVYCEMQDEARL